MDEHVQFGKTPRSRIMSRCDKHLLPIPPNMYQQLSEFYFQPMFPVKSTQRGLLIGGWSGEPFWNYRGGKREPAAKGWFHAPHHGSLPSDCHRRAPTALCKSVLQTHSHWKEKNVTGCLPSSQDSWRGLMS